MINSYCRICGLYISVPDDFAGGKGACPRCRTSLRIPKPLLPDSPDYLEGLRYLAGGVDTHARAEERPELPAPSLGPSNQYECVKCGMKFESLASSQCPQGKCPQCGTLNDKPSRADVKFPREYPSDDAAGQVDSEVKVEGEFLVAEPVEEQGSGGTVFQGVALLPDGSPDDPLDVDSPPTVEQGGDDLQLKPGQWAYLIKGQRHGPVDTATLRELIEAGRINRSVMVLRAGDESWEPLESFEGFADAALREKAEAPTFEHGSPLLRVRGFATSANYLVWMFVVVACVMFMLFVTRQTFVEFGLLAFRIAGIALSALALIGAGYGVFQFIQYRDVLGRTSRRARTLAVFAVVGLLGCIVGTGYIVSSVEKPSSIVREASFIAKAKQMFSIFAQADVEESYGVVSWDEFKFNGRDIGKQFGQLRRLEEKETLIANVFDDFLQAFEPTYDSADMVPEEISGWRVVRQTIDVTDVSVTCPVSQRRILFTIRAGMLISLKID